MHEITAATRAVVRAAVPSIGLTEAGIGMHFLCADRAMAILTTKLDLDTILLMARWWSNTMLLYLHTTEKSFAEGLAIKTFQNGDYTLIPPVHAGN